ncbi:MAG: hypothetical protein COU09_00260, partial [Candidatus Harrisonbacteria bacterium CG10_big_fil_rev_8_21_14_0_10_44_23]
MMTPKEKKGLKDSLNTAHGDYERGLKSRAFFKTHDNMLSDDLVQDTFMKTWIYLAKGGRIDIM